MIRYFFHLSSCRKIRKSEHPSARNIHGTEMAEAFLAQVNDGLQFEDGNCLIRECPEPNITNETFYPWETWMDRKTQRQSVASNHKE